MRTRRVEPSGSARNRFRGTYPLVTVQLIWPVRDTVRWTW